MAPLIDPAGRPLKYSKPQSPETADAGPAASGAAATAASPAPGQTAPATGAAPIKDSNIETFAADVLDASMTVPVIVDFWAPWCGPCKQLGPALEKAVTEAKGKVRMVKVNIDDNPEIAQQLRIQSIPTVYAFFQGQPIDGFMGAIPDSQVQKFVQGLVATVAKLPGAAPDEEEAQLEDMLGVATEALAGGDVSAAAQLFGQILQADPGNPKAAAGLARCYLESGDLERAKTTLSLVRPDGAADEAVRAMQAELKLRETAQAQLQSQSQSQSAAQVPGETAPAAGPDPALLRAKVEANPTDLQARYDLALALDASGMRDEAIDQLLDIVKRERKWNDDAARQHLVTLFEAMGPADPRTLAARRRLSAILFA